MKLRHYHWLIGVQLLFLLPSTGQSVDLGGLYKVTTADSLDIFVVPGYEVYGAHTYYYLPANLRLSIRPDGNREFNFMTYETEPGKGISGAILHFLMVWGLTPEQEKEIEQIIQVNVDSSAIVAGSISLQVPAKEPSFTIIGKSNVAEVLRTKWSMPPVASVIAGTKMALSYRLDSHEADLVMDAIRNPDKLKDIKILLHYQLDGGVRDLWYTKFKEAEYILSASLYDLLRPVLSDEKPDKK